MEEIMQSNSFFIIPLVLAYGSICGVWFVVSKKTNWWPLESVGSSTNPKVDFVVSLVAGVLVLVIGQLYSAGFLIPNTSSTFMNGVIWMLNNVIIFSPIFISIAIRKQSLSTIFISGSNIPFKLLYGLVVSIIGIFVFLLIRGELGRFTEIMSSAIEFNRLTYFPAVFFENLAVAFLFVRMKWLFGTRWAIAIPSILFALAHVPGSIAEGDPWSHIAIFFLLTGSLTTIILYTTYRSRDILWLGIVHYLMDIAIKAF